MGAADLPPNHDTSAVSVDVTADADLGDEASHTSAGADTCAHIDDEATRVDLGTHLDQQ